jgi:hypothetical protein
VKDMAINKLKQERAKYKAKYTLNTFVDFGLSIPLYITEKCYYAAGCIEEKLTGEKTWTDWNTVKEYTPGYNKREVLREKWDTGKGVDMINSNLVGMVAFLAVGPVVAEATYHGLEKLIPQNSHVIREITTSAATSIAGYIAGNGTVIVDYAFFRDRKNHVKEDGSINLKKVYQTGKNFILGALKFDAFFFGGKILMQALMINKGMNPAEASVSYDTIGTMLWYAYIIPTYVTNGTIKPSVLPECMKITVPINTVNSDV